MLKVRIFTSSSTSFAENVINKFIINHPNAKIIDIKMNGDGHSVCMTYMIMYKE